MYNLHKTPEMLALEQQWNKQSQKQKHRDSSQALQVVLEGSKVSDLHVPPLPAAVALMIEMCHNINVRYRDLEKTIQTDPGLSVKILQIANSAYYGQTSKISSIIRALTVLGLDEVKTIGLGYKLADVIRQMASEVFDLGAFWEDSLVMAVLGREIARHKGIPLVDEAFLAGLLQNVGVVVLAGCKKDQYRELLEDPAILSSATLVSKEMDAIGVDHARVGAEICDIWSFPKILVHAIRVHHTPPATLQCGNPVSEIHSLVYASSLMPDFINGRRPVEIINELEQRGILALKDFEPVFYRAMDAFAGLSQLFEQHLPKDSQSASLMAATLERLKRITDSHQNIFQYPA